MNEKNHIDLEDCKNKRLYLVRSRNLMEGLGIFCEADKAFYGLRYKFGSTFVEREYHWDTGAPYGTVKPLELLETEIPENLNLNREDKALREFLFSLVPTDKLKTSWRT